MNRLSLAFLTGLLLFASANARAQEASPQPTVKELQEQLNEQQQRLDELSKRLEGVEETPPTDTPADVAAVDEDELDWTKKIKLGLFSVETADGFFKLRIKGRIHMDGRFSPEHGEAGVDNSFFLRRARIEFVGHLHKRLKYDIGLEFGRTKDADLRNGWIELNVMDELRLRAGQMLLPYSDVRLTSSKYLNHLERTTQINTIVALRDLGVMVHGDVGDGLLHYDLGLYNGAGENAKIDVNDDFDVVGRVVVTPFGDSNLSFSLNYLFHPTDRSETGPIDKFTSQLAVFLDYDPTNRRLGHRQLFGGGFKFSTGPFELKAEANAEYSEDMILAAAPNEELNLLNWSYLVDVTYVLTGEEIKQKPSGGRVTPDTPLYDPETQKWGMGALQLSVRFEDFHADPATVKRGFAVGSDTMRAVSTAVHWYWWHDVRFSVDYTYSRFEHNVVDADGESRSGDHVVIGRLAFFF